MQGRGLFGFDVGLEPRLQACPFAGGPQEHHLEGLDGDGERGRDLGERLLPEHHLAQHLLGARRLRLQPLRELGGGGAKGCRHAHVL